jgi:hypothetical protein
MKYRVKIAWWNDNLVSRDYYGEVWGTYAGYDEENASIEEYASKEEAKARIEYLKNRNGGYVKAEIE